jgi:hypothetical protein
MRVLFYIWLQASFLSKWEWFPPEIHQLDKVVTLDVFRENCIRKTSVGNVLLSARLDARLWWPSVGGRPLHLAVDSGGWPNFAMVLQWFYTQRMADRSVWWTANQPPPRLQGRVAIRIQTVGCNDRPAVGVAVRQSRPPGGVADSMLFGNRLRGPSNVRSRLTNIQTSDNPTTRLNLAFTLK